jgi:predicted amidohydrolase YtcJ
VLEVYEELRENRKASTSNKPLLRIEHLGFPSEANFIKMESLGVHAVMQPIFIKELGANFRNYLTDDYLEYVYPFRSVLQHKINLSFSTDAPVVKDFDPWQGIQTAMQRKDAHGHVIGAGETISLNKAVHAYTLGSAIANGEEENVGSITAGKHADFIILNDDPATLPFGELASCRVIATFIAGECASNNM